jgi:poly(A) polymerase
MNKLLVCPLRRRGVELLDESGLIPVLLSELSAMKGCDQPPQFHPEGDVWIHTLLVLEKLDHPSLALAWAALLHDVGKPPCRSQAPGDRVRFNCHESKGAEMSLEITRRFKLSGDDSERVRVLVAEHMRANQVQEMRVSTLKRFFRQDHFSELMELLKADCLASHADLTLYDFCAQRMAEFEKEGREQVLKPKSLITGDDLIALGFKPGKKFKEILVSVENEQLEGRLKNKEEAVSFVRKNYL